MTNATISREQLHITAFNLAWEQGAPSPDDPTTRQVVFGNREYNTRTMGGAIITATRDSEGSPMELAVSDYTNHCKGVPGLAGTEPTSVLLDTVTIDMCTGGTERTQGEVREPRQRPVLLRWLPWESLSPRVKVGAATNERTSKPYGLHTENTAFYAASLLLRRQRNLPTDAAARTYLASKP